MIDYILVYVLYYWLLFSHLPQVHVKVILYGKSVATRYPSYVTHYTTM